MSFECFWECDSFSIAELLGHVCSGVIFWMLSINVVFFAAALFQMENVRNFSCKSSINNQTHFSSIHWTDHRQYGYNDHIRLSLRYRVSCLAIWPLLWSNISIRCWLLHWLYGLSIRMVQLSKWFNQIHVTHNCKITTRNHIQWIQLGRMQYGKIHCCKV